MDRSLYYDERRRRRRRPPGGRVHDGRRMVVASVAREGSRRYVMASGGVDIGVDRDPIAKKRRRISRTVEGTRDDAELATARLRLAKHVSRLQTRQDISAVGWCGARAVASGRPRVFRRSSKSWLEPSVWIGGLDCSGGIRVGCYAASLPRLMRTRRPSSSKTAISSSLAPRASR
jgi:hypothetical protein